MKFETKTFILPSGFDMAGFRRSQENKVLWEKARILGKEGKEIFCVTMEDLGSCEDDMYTTKYHIHTEKGSCGHKSVDECNKTIERIYGNRYGILANKPGYIAWQGTNIPFINELRMIPIRVHFHLHGSYVDVLAETKEVLV